MNKIKSSERIKKIEAQLDAPIEDILHKMHWDKDMKHRDIGRVLGLPRATVTRWFGLLNVPTQSCRRFTDKNLTSWLYKIGKLKKKSRYEGLDRRIQRTKANVNIDFFKKWSSEMAYVLGFFAADGGMFINSEGSKYIQFVSTDKEILIKIKRLMNSNHKISIKKRSSKTFGWKTCYLIQIGSKEMFNDLIKFGFTPKKDLHLRLPYIPNKYFSHFVRGYFDGDGCISFGTFKRKDRNNKISFYITTCFVSGDRNFLRQLFKKLHLTADIGGGSLKNKSHNRAYQLSYSKNDSKKLFKYMYTNKDFKLDYCLERKYNKFVEAFKIVGA